MARTRPIIVLWVLLTGFTYITLGNNYCSSLQSQDIVSCRRGSVSKQVCLANGCCWNETKAAEVSRNGQNVSDIVCYRSKYLNGTCIRYPETGICFPYLNTSVPQYRDTPRFIDYKVGLNKTDQLLFQFQHLVTVIAKDAVSETCLVKIRKILCQYILTPCAEDGSPIQICRRDCKLLEKECPDTLQKLLGAGRVSLTRAKSFFVHLYLPDCRNLRTREELAKDGESCYMTGLFLEETVDTKNDMGTTALIQIITIAAVAFSCLIVTGIIIFIVCRRRKKRKETASDTGASSMAVTRRPTITFPSISVKDHIIQLTADDLLKSKMSIKDIKEIKQYPVDMIAYEKDLGEGQFGQVFQGRAVGLDEQYPEGEVVVAVKTLKKGSSEESKSEFEQETLLMNYLHHPNIVRLLAVSAMEEPYCMIFEFMSKGDLSEFLRKSEFKDEDETEPLDENKNYLAEDTLIKMCIDIAKGLQFLASNRLIHRDVATRNCLVSDDLTIKIADFGMSRDVYSSNYYKIERETLLPVRWLAPEAVLFGKFTVQSDIYSYGVLLWEVFTFSMQPYYGYTNKEVLDFIRKGVHLGQPDLCPDFVYEIMADCWAMDPDYRPNYHSILNRLQRKEPRYEIPSIIWSDPGLVEGSLYQNVPTFQNENGDLPETAEAACDDPLLPSNSHSGESDHEGVHLRNNPLYNARHEEERKRDALWHDVIDNAA